MRGLAHLALIALFAAGAAASTFNIQGTNLTVTSNNLQISFRGADVIGIVNQITGETYLRAPSQNVQLNLTLVQSPTTGLAPVGTWTLSGSTASLSFSDSNRTVSVSVTVDPSKQEVVVDLTGTAQQGGVQQLIWGVTGFDMTVGAFILPGWGGMEINGASLQSQSSYSFFGDLWDAPFSLFQTNLGGLTVFSTDTNALNKDLLVSANQEQTANEWFYVEAQAPLSTATLAGPIEWRLAAYQGGWQVGARIYRDWHNGVAPAVPLTGGRAWVNNIETVVQVGGGHPYQTSDLDSLATVLVPSKTLLYLYDWRDQGYDVGYPDYDWDPSTPAFVAYAHKLGFRVMLHTDVLGVAPTSSDYAAVQQFQIRDPNTLALQGWNWDLPASTPNRYALIDPAASEWRSLFTTRITPAIQTLQADAVHLDFSVTGNDGNGLIEGRNFNQGLAQLETDLLTAFPNLVLGAEESNAAISPQESFSQPLYWSSSGLSPAITPPVPVASYAMPNVHRYWHLGVTNPYESGFVQNLEQYEAQSVLPTFYSQVPSYTQTDMARYLGVVSAFQNDNLQPAWDSAWNGAILAYQGTGGVTASLTDSGTAIQLATSQSGSSTTLYQRAHNVNQLNSALSVDNWPAYNGTLTLGLDPADQYWLDPFRQNTALAHITGLPSGARLGLGDGTLVTSQFSYVQVQPPASASFDFLSNFWLATTGVTYQGVDGPPVGGAFAQVMNMTVGGVTNYGVYTQPPYNTESGGSIFFQYSIPVPSSGGVVLTFAAGILDSAIGKRNIPMSFSVAINDAVLWSQIISTGAWQPGSIDLAAYRGQTIQVRFITGDGPSNNSGFTWGGWSELQLDIAGVDILGPISLSVPAGVTASNIVASGANSTVNNGTATVTGLPAGGTILVLNGTPSTVSAGSSLLNLPFTLSQGSSESLAGPPVGAYAGTGVIGSTTSGGITKPTTLYAFGPQNGQTIFSWLVRLPPSPALAFSFSAAYWDGYAPASQGYLMSVRINGTNLWQHNVNKGGGWNYGAVGLSQWAGQTVLLELITDTLGPNYDDFTSWGELAFSVAAGSNCSVTLGSNGPLTAPNTGASGSISVTTGSGCEWITQGESSWITASANVSAGNGTVSYVVAPNYGAARQSTLVVAGVELAVSQAGYSRCDVKQDGITDVIDVQAMVNEALGASAAVDDLNQDGRVNIVDIQLVINSALGMNCLASQ